MDTEIWRPNGRTITICFCECVRVRRLISSELSSPTFGRERRHAFERRPGGRDPEIIIDNDLQVLGPKARAAAAAAGVGRRRRVAKQERRRRLGAARQQTNVVSCLLE